MQQFVDMLGALGQSARLEIFRLLVRAGPTGLCVEEIRERLRVPGSTLSHHLDTLARCGLLNARREGRFIFYGIDWQRAAGLIRFLTQDCCADLHEKVTGGEGEGRLSMPASKGNDRGSVQQPSLPAKRRARLSRTGARGGR
jgi:DNA-binding transcriptional ArsR family regulator